MDLNIVILYESVRSERQGIKAAKIFENKLNECKLTSTLVDPLVIL